jgi:hypothetical protein
LRFKRNNKVSRNFTQDDKIETVGNSGIVKRRVKPAYVSIPLERREAKKVFGDAKAIIEQ